MHADIIPLVAILSTFGATVYVIYLILTHRQRMKMIEKGISRLEISQVRSQADTSLKYGLMLIALGLAISLAQICETYNILIGGETALAFVPIFVGVALIISAIIERKREKRVSQQIDQMKMESAS